MAYLRQSPTPFDLIWLHQLQGPLRIDLYCWSTWLSRQIRKDGPPVMVAWQDLHERLGTQIVGLRAFRFQALRYLETLHDLSPGFPAKATSEGLLVMSPRATPELGSPLRPEEGSLLLPEQK